MKAETRRTGIEKPRSDTMPAFPEELVGWPLDIKAHDQGLDIGQFTISWELLLAWNAAPVGFNEGDFYRFSRQGRVITVHNIGERLFGPGRDTVVQDSEMAQVWNGTGLEVGTIWAMAKRHCMQLQTHENIRNAMARGLVRVTNPYCLQCATIAQLIADLLMDLKVKSALKKGDSDVS